MPPARHIEAIELLAGVLGRADEAAPAADFYGDVCRTICATAGVERCIIFLYDSALRRVRAVGAHGVDLTAFRDVYVTPDTAPVARRALELDAVVEVDGEELLPELPAGFAHLVRDRRLVCAPMAASGRWAGVVLADRAAGAPPVADDQRELLWTLGKAVALAVMARGAARSAERARELERRIDLAREVHDGVVQRLFGVSLALDGDGPLPAEARERCTEEVQAAMAELRDAVQRPLGRAARPAHASFGEELDRLAAAHADLRLRRELAAVPPPALEALAQSVLAEAVRNARKHASPTSVVVATRSVDDAFVLEVTNDGVGARGDAGAAVAGMGLRLTAFEALQCGGVLEFGRRGEDRWQVRLVVPVGDDG